MKQKKQTQMFCCSYVVGDGGDARKARQGVMLAVLSQFFTRLRDPKKTRQLSFVYVFGISQARNHGTVTVVVAVAVAVVVVAPAIFFSISVVAKNRQIVGVFASF